MPKVVAWKCEQTDALFHTEDEYRKHLRRLARERMKERARLRAEREYEERIRTFLMGAQSFDGIAAWLEANTALLYTKIAHHNRWRKQAALPVITDVRVEKMRWEPMTYCSHSAPRGRKQVWDSRNNPDNHPIHHPAWRGRFSFVIDDHTNWDSSAWRHAGICTGAGGGGNAKMSYDLILWAEDFPMLCANAILRDELNLRDVPYPAVRRALRMIGLSGKTVGDP